jgi:hypothetical protein
MICGHCGNKITGISSTSKSKKIHHYYKCAGNYKGTCKKRTIRKQFIEGEVIAAIIGDGTERNKHGILTDEFIDLVAAETYLLIQSEQNDTEIKRLENLVAENQKAINNLMQALMLGKIADTILSQIEKLENENKELKEKVAELQAKEAKVDDKKEAEKEEKLNSQVEDVLSRLEKLMNGTETSKKEEPTVNPEFGFLGSLEPKKGDK